MKYENAKTILVKQSNKGFIRAELKLSNDPIYALIPHCSK